VASTSQVASRRVAAEHVINSLRTHKKALVDQALLVSSQLIRVAGLWEEEYPLLLEAASQFWFAPVKNPAASIKVHHHNAILHIRSPASTLYVISHLYSNHNNPPHFFGSL